MDKSGGPFWVFDYVDSAAEMLLYALRTARRVACLPLCVLSLQVCVL